MKRTLFILLCMLPFLSACTKSKKIHERNLAEIAAYASANNLTTQSTASGLNYVITKEGDGQFPTINSNVKVNYTGYLTNETIFDQGQNVTFPLSNVILGWQEGIQKISRGGSAILLIPSNLAYGSQATGGIPANAVLIFEVDLLDF